MLEQHSHLTSPLPDLLSHLAGKDNISNQQTERVKKSFVEECYLAPEATKRSTHSLASDTTKQRVEKECSLWARCLTEEFGTELSGEVGIAPGGRIILLHKIDHYLLRQIALPFPPHPQQRRKRNISSSHWVASFACTIRSNRKER